MSESPDDNIRVFVCYSHADQRWLDRLEVHLAPLRRRHPVDVWSDRRIQFGSRWRDEIRMAIERCNVGVLLVSPDFLASAFIADHEIPPLLKAADDRGALIIPVIVGPCLFLRYKELALFHAANDPTEALLCMDEGDSEQVFVDVAEQILDRAERAEEAQESPRFPPSPVHEDFLDPDTWTRLVKIGNWVYDTSEDRIVGSGPNTFLLSREEYGAESFSVEARLSFSPHPTSPKQKLGFNAGLILGWTHEKENPRYHNVLFTGDEILLERIGFQDRRGRSAEHLTPGHPLEIVPGKEYAFRANVSDRTVVVEVDGVEVLRSDDGPFTPGRVGVRPWRSTLTIRSLEVRRLSP